MQRHARIRQLWRCVALMATRPPAVAAPWAALRRRSPAPQLHHKVTPPAKAGTNLALCVGFSATPRSPPQVPPPAHHRAPPSASQHPALHRLPPRHHSSPRAWPPRQSRRGLGSASEYTTSHHAHLLCHCPGTHQLPIIHCVCTHLGAALCLLETGPASDTKPPCGVCIMAHHRRVACHTFCLAFQRANSAMVAPHVHALDSWRAVRAHGHRGSPHRLCSPDCLQPVMFRHQRCNWLLNAPVHHA